MLVNRVLLGLDDIEKYKDDPRFMTEIIRRSKEKSFYDISSDDVKHNLDFVCMIIDLFGNDTDFIKKVVNEFLRSIEYEIIINFENKIELLKDGITVLIKLGELNNDLPTFINYQKKLKIYFNEVEYYNRKEIIELEENIPSGFSFLLRCFDGNDLLIDYFAKQLIDNYFEKNVFLILYKARKYYNSYEEMEADLKRFIFKLLFKFDVALSVYTINNPIILEYAKYSLLKTNIIFDSNKLGDILLYVQALMKDYINQSGRFISFGMEEALYMVFSDLNMLDTLEEWIKDYSYLVFDEKLIEHAIEFRDNMGNNDLIIYLEIEECIKKIIGRDLINKNKPNKKIIHLRDYK